MDTHLWERSNEKIKWYLFHLSLYTSASDVVSAIADALMGTYSPTPMHPMDVKAAGFEICALLIEPKPYFLLIR